MIFKIRPDTLSVYGIKNLSELPESTYFQQKAKVQQILPLIQLIIKIESKHGYTRSQPA